MNEQNSDAPDLSKPAVALLEALLRQLPLRPVDPWIPDVPRSVRYLSGALSAEETRTMDQSLLASREARDRLRATRAALRKLQKQPWAEVAEQARTDDEAAPVAQAWIELVAERITATQRVRNWWRSRDWTAVRQEVAAGLQEAQVAWMAFLAFSEQWKLELGRPHTALAKGAESASRIPGSGLIEGTTVHAEIEQDGTLSLTLILPSTAGQVGSIALNRHAHLALALQGEVWPLASQRIETEITQFTLPAVGTALGLPTGSIPPELIRIDIGDFDPATPGERFTLLAEVEGRSGKPLPGSPATIEFSKAPRWEGGAIKLEIAMPAETRAAFPAHHLELGLILSPRDTQHLGRWPLNGWDDNPRTLTLMCPGSPDASVPFASCLRARLMAQSIP